MSHLYKFKFKPKEGGRKTFRPKLFQAQRFNRLYPKFYARQGHKEIELKPRKIGTTTGCCFFCEDDPTTASRRSRAGGCATRPRPGP